MPKSRRPQPAILTAATADRHRLYEEAVQSPDAEMDFVEKVYQRLRGRKPKSLREDFCGTGASSCEWVRRGKDHTAVGLDLHQPTLQWGQTHNVGSLPEEARKRVRLLKSDVRTPPREARNVDVINSMNFSYWIFKDRAMLTQYFATVRESLAEGGVYFLDHYGGYEAMKLQEERRRVKGGFTYVWEQAAYNPITADYVCHIHFEFKKGPAMKKAFTYTWRLWTLPEVREMLADAGFRNVTVYWEGDDGKGGGNGVFRPRKVGDPDAAFICYLTAEK